jgi:putative endonuclease
MTDAHSLGQSGEDLAASWLRKKGYRVAFRNWRWGKHEIDIVAENNEYIIFVEVKTRSSEFMTDLGTLISKTKQQSIIWAADGYIRRFGVDKPARFDAITIVGEGEEQKLEHFEDIFYVTLR